MKRRQFLKLLMWSPVVCTFAPAVVPATKSIISPDTSPGTKRWLIDDGGFLVPQEFVKELEAHAKSGEPIIGKPVHIKFTSAETVFRHVGR